MHVYNKAVDMVVTFDTKGNATPVRFRLMNEHGEQQVIKITKVNYSNKSLIKVVYICEINLNNGRITCEIWFMIQEMKWILFSIG
jgi:N-acetyl-gamma-glutamylphosphate reductase